MDLEALLRDVIKPELNRIYTEPPSALHGGADMGLFCREHAFHCAVLCILLGFPAAIKRGDFSAILDEDTGVTSYGDESDHAWCEVGGIVPVDLSANFEYYGTRLPNLDLVYGPGRRGVYEVSYTGDVGEFEKHMRGEAPLPKLLYSERETVQIPIGEMLDDPHCFLIKPPRGGLEELFGKVIFNSINLHLFDLAHGRTRRLTTYKDSKSTVRTIGNRYPDATSRVKRLLAETSTT